MIKLFLILISFSSVFGVEPHAGDKISPHPHGKPRPVDSGRQVAERRYAKNELKPCGNPFPIVEGKLHLFQAWVHKVDGNYIPTDENSKIRECTVMKVDGDNKVTQRLLSGISDTTNKLLTRVPGTLLGDGYDGKQFYTVLSNLDPSQAANWVVVPCTDQPKDGEEPIIMNGANFGGSHEISDRTLPSETTPEMPI